jgi:AbrB family looped-hinge helix DNA binding protein
MTTVVSSKGQIVLPAAIRQQDGVEAGQEFEIERVDAGEYRLVRRVPPPNEGLVDWLLACPEKGFFTPVPSESTDSLIAATALAHGLVVASRNVRDFEPAGVRVLDPFV